MKALINIKTEKMPIRCQVLSSAGTSYSGKGWASKLGKVGLLLHSKPGDFQLQDMLFAFWTCACLTFSAVIMFAANLRDHWQ